MKRMLILASAPSMIGQFNIENILILQGMGYEVHAACNFNIVGIMNTESLESLKIKLDNIGVIIHQVDFKRGIGDMRSNINAYKQLINVMKQNNFEFIHCHSPIGGVIGRIASKKMKVPVIYTAHGFQFFKGGSFKDWLLFYPIEKYLSRYTDILITINKEDYELAKKFRHPRVYKVPGVGIDYKKYSQQIEPDKVNYLKEKLLINDDTKVMISVGELSVRKNHIVGIQAISKLNNFDIIYLICGNGPEEDNLKKEAERLSVQSKVIFLGYQTNIEKYYAISDIALFPSRREGLGLAGLEAMASGIPLISSYLGGIKDYTENGKTGITIQNPKNSIEISEAIQTLTNESAISLKEIKENNKIIAKKFDKNEVSKIMKDIYVSIRKEK